MGQKTHPFGLRLGITEAHRSRWYAPKALFGELLVEDQKIAHRSRWYAPKALFGELLVEDQKIRTFLDKRLNRRPPSAMVSDIHIERTREELKVIVKTARPGLVIGPKGAEVERMTEELQYMTGRKVAISIIEIKNPDMDAQLIAEAIAEQLVKRASFRKAAKMKADAAMASGAQGVKVQLAGRLGGAEMSRYLDIRLGSLPLSTLQARIEYGFAQAFTTYGAIGVQTWVYKGMYTTERTEEESNAAGGRARARGRR